MNTNKEQKYKITEDHIGIFDNFFDDSLIDGYIEHFERMDSAGITIDRRATFKDHYCQDKSCSVFADAYLTKEAFIPYVVQPFAKVFFEECYGRYMQKYSILEEYDKHGIIDIKVQKTKPAGGYHVWHSENMSMRFRNRISVFSLYLNDVSEGGETEFLYQKQRFEPIRNRLLIWPATYTHAHRGNPPLSNDKYLLTGWIEYVA